MKKTEKIKTLKQLVPIVERLKEEGKKIVLATGVFDLVHPGHINYFQEARKLGDVVVVSIVDDKFVTKGRGRPFFKQDTRLTWLAALEDIDFVVLNGDYGPHEAMRKLKPHFFAKGQSDRKRIKNKNNSHKQKHRPWGDKRFFVMSS